MNMVLERFDKESSYTLGHLYVLHDEPLMQCKDGEIVYVDRTYVCDCLELKPKNPKKSKRENGLCAVEPGKYLVLITKSFYWKRWLPQVMAKGYGSVRFHPGNFPCHCFGGIIPGFNRRKGMVTNSRSALMKVMDLISAAIDRDESVYLTII